MGVLLFVSLIRGWIVLGRYHREIVERLDGRAAKDADVISKLTAEITQKNATEEAAKTLLSSVRAALTAGGDAP